MEEEIKSLVGASAEEKARMIAEFLDNKKGKDIKILKTNDVTGIADYFVLCTGNSSTQIKALAGEVEYQMGQRGIDPYHSEGRDNNAWIVIDYSDVIVHVFSREARDFYNIEKLYKNTNEI